MNVSLSQVRRRSYINIMDIEESLIDGAALKVSCVETEPLVTFRNSLCCWKTCCLAKVDYEPFKVDRCSACGFF